MWTWGEETGGGRTFLSLPQPPKLLSGPGIVPPVLMGKLVLTQELFAPECKMHCFLH